MEGRVLRKYFIGVVDHCSGEFAQPTQQAFSPSYTVINNRVWLNINPRPPELQQKLDKQRENDTEAPDGNSHKLR